MAAVFPGNVKSFTPKTDGVDKIYASHINDLQDEVTAIETELKKPANQTIVNAANSDKLDGLDSTAFGRPVFLTTPKTGSAWSNATKTTADRAIVDLSAAFGVPAGIKAVLMGIQTQASAANAYLRFGPTETYNYTLVCRTGVANAIEHAYGIIPCDENGDIYCYPSATIAGVYVYIWGYWL